VSSALGAFVCVLGWSAFAFADPPDPPSLGASWQASPGFFRVPVVALASPGVTLVGGLGYGYTESQSAAPGGHHRLEGRVAASLAPLPGLGLAVGTNLRHDQHENDGLGTDQGTVVDSDVHAQFGARLDSDWYLGGGLAAAFTRGDTFARSIENPALDALLLGAYLPRESAFGLGMLAGFRYDRTAGVARDPARYRSGDRLSLELSQFDAVLVGFGTSYRFGATELLGELSCDLLVGSGAPALDKSPLRLTLGARQQFGDRLGVRLMADTSLSARPGVGPSDPLTPIEPRFQVLLAMAYHWLGTPPRAAPPAAEPPAPEPPSRAPDPPPRFASLEVDVTTLEGYPLSDATVEILDGDQATSVPHDSLEKYRLDQLAVRDVTLRVSAVRLQTHSEPVHLAPGVPLRIGVKLAPAAAMGQLRGLVRSFNGVGLRARIRIEPLGTVVQTDAAGTFKADVPPGKYDVVVEAVGHDVQRRHVEVQADGVVILNADLVRGHP
jgi:hypothetical protein